MASSEFSCLELDDWPSDYEELDDSEEEEEIISLDYFKGVDWSLIF
jgi:hypothetical protein